MDSPYTPDLTYIADPPMLRVHKVEQPVHRRNAIEVRRHFAYQSVTGYDGGGRYEILSDEIVKHIIRSGRYLERLEVISTRPIRAPVISVVKAHDVFGMFIQ